MENKHIYNFYVTLRIDCCGVYGFIPNVPLTAVAETEEEAKNKVRRSLEASIFKFERTEIDPHKR
jgi:hypothetical protein